MIRWLFPLGLLVTLLLGSCTASRVPAAATDAEQPIEFIVLQLNDVYEIAPLEGGRAGGLARVATVRRELLAENPNVITVMAGDFLSPSFLGTLSYTTPTGEREKIAGLQMIETLNAMGLDYATFGNHEFDLKTLALLERRLDQSDFAYTVCNARAVTEAGEVRPFRQRDAPVADYLVHEVAVAGGPPLRIGLIGVVLPFNRTDYVRYTDVTASFRRALTEVAATSDLTLAITHQNVEEDEALAAAVPGVPLFLGGHEHAKLSRYVDRTVIAKADANAKTVFVHRITYYPASGATEISSTLRTVDDSIAEDPATKAVADKWLSRAGELMTEMGYDPDRPVLQLTAPLICQEAAIRTSQTNYGRLTTAAIAAALPEADVYVLNAGSMRLDDNLAGVVTEYDVLRTYPYGGSFVTLELPGQTLVRLLEAGLTTNYGDGGYLQHRGVGADGKTVGGAPIDRDRRYRVTLPEFMAKGYEANLEFLKEYYTGSPAATLAVADGELKNDLRDIVIWHMLRLGSL